MNPRVNIRPIPGKTYAGQPRTPLTFSLVLAMTSASTPMPVMTRKTSSSLCWGSSRSRVVALEAAPTTNSELAELHQTHVDAPVLAGEDDLKSVLDLVDRQVEVAGQQVAGTARQQPDGVSVPTSEVATARTVPSPPSGQTMSTPWSSARSRA